MLNLILAVGIGIAAILGLMIGIRLGKGWAKGEAAPWLERIRPLEDENKQLEQALAREREITAQLRVDLARVEEREDAEKKKYEQMKADLPSAFGSLAADVLRSNSESFLNLAKQELGGQNTAAEQNLAAKELAIKNLLDPLGVALNNLGEQARGMEEKRSTAYGEVKTLIETIQTSIPTSLEALKNETAQLITALRSPKTRGNWGELQLKLCVEYAGMVQYCSFSEQVSVRSEADRLLQPDMTIQLPNGREIIVDAKTPLDAFLPSGASLDPAAHAARLIAHAVRVKDHLKNLSGKKYWEQFQKAPEFVVCFLPSEALFSAALEADPSLIEFSSRNNVVMATPTTLIALLKAVAYGWQQSEVTKNATDIYEAGKKVYKQLVTAQKYVTSLGTALGNAVSRYNDFIGAVEGNKGAFVYGRQLGDLVHGGDELADLKALQPDIRSLKSKEWTQPLLAVVASSSESEENES
jgi:DNA recombination protein RmuC